MKRNRQDRTEPIGRGGIWREGIWVGGGIGIVAAVAVVARGAVMLAALAQLGPFDQLDEDPDSYRHIAETLAASGTFGITAADGSVDPTAFRPPLYPWLLSWFAVGGRIGNLAVGLLHWTVGVLTCLGVFAVVRALVSPTPEAGSMGKNRPRCGDHVAVAAGCLTAIDPLLLMQSTLVMTETLAAGLAVAAWWAATRSWILATEEHGQRRDRRRDWRRGWLWAAAVGGTLAAGFLCRPVFAVWILLWLLWLVAVLWWSSPELHRASLRHWAGRHAIAILAIVGVSVAAWTSRNHQAIGKPVWATTHGGYTLLLGNNPYFYDYLDSRSFAEAAFWGAAWDAEAFHEDWANRQARANRAAEAGRDRGAKHPDSELALNQLAGDHAKQEIRRRPGMFVYASLVRVARLWSPVPRVGNEVGVASWVIGGFYVALGIGGVVGVWRLRRRLLTPGWGPPLLLIIALTGVHAVYWSNLRMRAPAMPMVAALAAVGFLGIGNRKSPTDIRDSTQC